MFGQNTCIGEKLKDLSSIGHVLLSDGPFKFTLKSAQNAKLAVNHTLKWNNSNLITNWETILTLNNYMGEINSEIISKLQVPLPNQDIVGSKNSSSQNM